MEMRNTALLPINAISMPIAPMKLRKWWTSMDCADVKKPPPQTGGKAWNHRDMLPSAQARKAEIVIAKNAAAARICAAWREPA
ncbi:gentisate 1,2-dioxygenase [Herbaspirillum frisingense]|uniref:Gentisate 1,2-dioxygenase n=2 Tax=Oxalobacteraceae TaxID=75682 RepID=A0ABU1PEA3_9BURK|nr:gentisate 1,2-dioxygenase [Herbaspirillum frisingense]